MINDIVKLKSDKGNGIDKVHDKDGIEVTDPTKIPKIFNEFFSSIGETISNSFPKGSGAKRKLSAQKDSIYFKPITAFEVHSHIKELNASKSVRPLDPSIKMIKIAGRIIILPTSKLPA